MELCEIAEEGKVRKICFTKYLAERMTRATGKKYNEKDSLMLCELGKDECPYQNQEEGILIPYMDENEIFSICKTHGFVEKKGLITKKQIKELQNFKIYS